MKIQKKSYVSHKTVFSFVLSTTCTEQNDIALFAYTQTFSIYFINLGVSALNRELGSGHAVTYHEHDGKPAFLTCNTRMMKIKGDGMVHPYYH